MSVSVIIPVFQGELTVAKCISSILSQDVSDLELIVVDDGSTDATPDIVDRMAESDTRVVVKHTANRGRQAARFTGVQSATREWVTFVDADDKLPEHAIGKLLQQASDDVDIVFGNAYTLGVDKVNRMDMHQFRHLAIRGEGTIGVPWGSLYRRKLMTHYLFDLPKDFYMGEDYIFWLRLIFSTCKPVAMVHDCVYDKGEDTTSSLFAWTADYAETIQHFRENSIPNEYRSTYLRDTISDRLSNLCSVALYQNDSKWRNHPFTVKLQSDISEINYKVPLSTWLYLHLPSVRLRKYYRKLIDWLRRRLKLLS